MVSCSSLRRLSDAPVRSHMLSSGRSASKAYLGSSCEKGMPVHGPHALHAQVIHAQGSSCSQTLLSLLHAQSKGTLDLGETALMKQEVICTCKCLCG